MRENPNASPEELQNLQEALIREGMAIDQPDPIKTPSTRPTEASAPSSDVMDFAAPIGELISQNMKKDDVPLETPQIPVTEDGQPDTRSYLLGKYKEAFDPERMRAAKEQARKKSLNLGTILAAGLVGIGGGEGGAGAQRILDMARTRADERFVDPILQEREDIKNKLEFGWKLSDRERKELGWSREDEEHNRANAIRQSENDSNSMQSDLARRLAKKMMPSGNFEGMSASQLKQSFPKMAKIYELEKEKLEKSEQKNIKERELSLKERQIKAAEDITKRKQTLAEQKEANKKTKFQEEAEKQSAKSFSEKVDFAEKVPSMLQTLNTMEQLVQSGEVETGPIGRHVYGWTGGFFSPKTQLFEQLENTLVLEQASKLSGVLSDSDLKLLQQSIPNQNMDEDVLVESIRITKGILRKAQEEALRQNAYVQEHGSLTGYNRSHLISSNAEKRKRFNPETGKIE